MKILILKPSSLGDVVQALPVLRLLKAHDSSHRVFWWISADLQELLREDSDLSGIFLFQRKDWGTPQRWKETFATIAQMRAQRFDWVIDLQGLARSACVAWLAAGGQTIGLEDWREGAPAWYDRVVPRPSPQTHAVDWYLEVLRPLGVPIHENFTWMPPRPNLAAALGSQWSVRGRRWVLINPGGRWANKRWPVEYYAEVVRNLTATHSELSFGVLGGKSESALGAAIAEVASDRVLDLTGKTSLSEMIEWIRISELVVTNDSGPMHIAAALGKPIVSIFGPTDPRRTGPYGQLERALRISLPCAPCLKPYCVFEKPLECLRAIRPEVVLSRIEKLLALE